MASIMLRALKDSDAPFMEEWMKNPQITQYFRFSNATMNHEKVLQFIQNSQTSENKHFAIVNREDEYLGTVSLKNINKIPNTAEYSIVLRKSIQGLGVAGEATKAILEKAFLDYHLKTIYINIPSNNVKAIHFYERMGFGKDTELEEIQLKQDYKFPLYFYSIDKESFSNKTCRLLEFSDKGDQRGKLIIAESNVNIPFNVRRVFYMFDTGKNVNRGEHANRRSEFVIICLCGSVIIETDNGKEKKEFVLCQPNQGLYLPRMIWKRMYGFSKDAILLVLSNELYDSEEYIRDYNAFQKEMAEIY